MTIGMIGCGNMGQALGRGIVQAGHSLLVIDKDQDKVRAAEKTLGASSRVGALDRLMSESDLVIVAIKPQDLGPLLSDMAPLSAGKDIVSIAAGTPIAFFQEKLPDARVARYMPSIAARVGKGYTAVSLGHDDQDFREKCMQIAETSGQAIEVPEKLIPSIIGLSGSGIAFILDFIDTMAMGGVRSGLTYQASLAAVTQTMRGAVELLAETGTHPQELVSQVCSPSGTTIEGITALKESGFHSGVMNAVGAAIQKARSF